MFIFVFDVDGTLTSTKEKIDTDFRLFFENFCKTNKVYIVTGSEYEVSEEQLGKNIIKNLEGFFPCSGNEFYQKNRKIYTNKFDLTYHERDILETFLNRSLFPTRTGSHFEKRNGLINFSVVGRNATKRQREEYIAWDKRTDERVYLVKKLRKLLPRLDFSIAGDTGIDIHLNGNDKGQIYPFIVEDDKEIVFFGDKCDEYGNDYPLAILADHCYHVKSWQETEMILRTNYSILNKSSSN